MDRTRKMLQAAQQFHCAADRCSLLSETEGTGWLPYPEVVNTALAAELAIKGLIRAHLGIDVRGHDLEQLFKRLPSEIQDLVRDPDMAPVLFGERLHEVRNTFEIWRYAYERGETSVGLTFIHRLASSSIAALAGVVSNPLPVNS